MIKKNVIYISKKFVGVVISLFIYDEAKKTKLWIEQTFGFEQQSQTKYPYSTPAKTKLPPFKIYKSDDGPYIT